MTATMVLMTSAKMAQTVTMTMSVMLMVGWQDDDGEEEE